MDEGKKAVLDKAVGDILKRYGEGSIMRLGDAHTMVTETIPTGSLSLDIALGVGGVPRGRITEIYGPESSGKTTLCQHIVAESQKMGGTAAYIDMEHALDPTYAAKCGVDIDNLLVSQPDTGEQALEIVETLVRSGGVDIVVVDSVAALVPRSEIEGDMGDATMGVQARLMSQALRKLSGAINQTKTTVVFTNQLRQKIGVMFGNPETTTGGNALKFYASVRMDIRRIGAIKDGETMVGFVMYGRPHFEGRDLWFIFRLMVDLAHQGKGYGRAAMQEVIKMIVAQPDCDEIYVSYEPENSVAAKLYKSLGFIDEGKMIEDEVLGRLPIKH